MTKDTLDKQKKTIELFQDSNLDRRLELGKRVTKKNLINILNYINFQDQDIIVNFKHSKYGNTISLNAKPEPCAGDTLNCILVNPTGFNKKLKSYNFQNIVLSDDEKIILATPESTVVDKDKLSFNLPNTSYEVNLRTVKRHPCRNIKVEVIQNGVLLPGTLLDFSAVSFGAKISITPPQSFQWIDSNKKVNIIIMNKQEVLFSGECEIVKQSSGVKTRTFVLKPLNNNLSRFKPKNFRSVRQNLLPSPNIIFSHPITKKIVNLEVEDISGSGLSVKEYYENSVLLPGMIIPVLDIEFASDFKINCKAQVIYQNLQNISTDNPLVKCGIAFLDMDMQDQAKLSALLHRFSNKRSYVCNRVDLDDLWKFFFKAGFVYPKKYAKINVNKDIFKETYEKLYIQNPHIARHFIYQDKGVIQGHISMVRTYEDTWLIHHHASSRSDTKAGIVVLNQIGRYINDFHSLYSTHMNYVICYFRPENKFPNNVFGGCARELGNKKGCSLDNFAYFYFPKIFELSHISGMQLVKTQPVDLLELENLYEKKSGGLMLEALDLKPDMIKSNLSNEYHTIGFKRERYLFSIKKDGDLKAIIMVNISDIGLNLSNLTNCISVFILDTLHLSQNMLYSAISRLTDYFGQEDTPVLISPASYMEEKSIPYEKTYSLWTLNMQNLDQYFKYMKNLLGQYYE